MADNAINMSQQQILEDLLGSQKLITVNYNLFAGECEHTNLRDAFLSVLEDEHRIQTELFDEMHNRGWYCVEAAQEEKLAQVRQKFTTA